MAAELFFFFWIRRNPTSRKAHFVGPGERIKPRLSQALTRDARPDSNSRLAVQILSLLPSRYVPRRRELASCLKKEESMKWMNK